MAQVGSDAPKSGRVTGKSQLLLRVLRRIGRVWVLPEDDRNNFKASYFFPQPFVTDVAHGRAGARLRRLPSPQRLRCTLVKECDIEPVLTSDRHAAVEDRDHRYAKTGDWCEALAPASQRIDGRHPQPSGREKTALIVLRTYSPLRLVACPTNSNG
jgi:hypothetical protein